MRETHSASKFVEFLEGKPAFKTVIEICESGKWRIHDKVAGAVMAALKGEIDGSREVDPCSPGGIDDLPDDTGSTSNSSYRMDVQRAGVGKVPAHLLSKLCSGGAYMLCFDGGVTWDQVGPHVGGAGSCLFRIQSDGKKNVHLRCHDQDVYLPSSSTELAEYAGLLAGIVGFSKCLDRGELVPAPGMLLVEGDSKFIIQAVQNALANRSATVKLENDTSLQPLFDLIISSLVGFEDLGVKVCVRHRPRRFNKVADQLTRRVRQEKQGNFQHDVLRACINASWSGHAASGSSPALKLQVSGCQDALIARIIEGSYMLYGDNHSKPVYKKEGPPGRSSVLIYFWDDRIGANWSGDFKFVVIEVIRRLSIYACGSLDGYDWVAP